VWKKKYAHLGVNELRRPRQLEDENTRLKRLVADLTLDKHMLSEALRKNAPSTRPPVTSTLPSMSKDARPHRFAEFATVACGSPK
jgi:hypothetical protein